MIVKWLTWFGAAFGLVHSSSADVLVLTNGSPAIHGLVVSAGESEVQFSVYDETGHTFSQRTFLRADVKHIVQTVDQQRLEQLSIERLSEYRELAEELASLDNDPVARRFALRLIFLVLYHADNTNSGTELRRSAAANLVALARNDQQRRQFGLIAFLAGLDANHDPPQAGTQPDDDELDQIMLTLVTALRRQQSVQASQILASDQGRQSHDRWATQLDPEDVTIAIRQKALNKALLAKLLAIEMRIRSGGGIPSALVNDGSNDLFESQRQRPPGTIWFPQLQNIAGFNLELSEFRLGRWKKPEPSAVD